MLYLKLLEMFILKTLFNKDEYVPTSKNFNPIKFFTILLLVGNLIFTFFLLNKIGNLYNRIEKECPSILIIKKEISTVKIEDKKP